MRTVGQLSAFLALPLIMAALMIAPGCGTLDPAGPYKGDKLLYDADFVIGSSYTTIQSFCQWERTYRGTAACPKGATEAADTLRAQAPKAIKDAWAARATYASVRNDANATALEKSLQVVRALLTIAASWTATRAQTP